jgi:diaminopimelate decarboxylase
MWPPNILCEAASLDLYSYRNGRLHCEGVPLERIADAVGTPTYVYSLGTVLGHYGRLAEAFAGVDCQIYYSVKANSSLALMAALAQAGAGFDVVSAGELYRVRRAGGAMGKTVFAGVGKTDAEMQLAVKAGIQMFNMESWPEAQRLNAIARRLGRKVRADFRINPDVDAHTHAHITTGRSENKFGVPIAEAPEMYDRARKLSHIDLVGVHLHIGSQITEVAPYQAAIRKTLVLVKTLRSRGHDIRTFDLGGGMGIIYDRERPRTAQEFAAAILPLLHGQGLKLLLEPGRFIVGNAGVLLTRVVYVKPAARKTFVIVDAGMNDLIRPTLYGAYHAIVPLRERAGRVPRRKIDVVGPICESGDFLAKDRLMPVPKEGQCLGVRSVGAYGFVMSSNYNSRGRAAEVLVDGKQWHVIRRRESYADLVRGEALPPAAAARARGRRG